MNTKVSMIVCSLVMASCTPSYVYRPTANATATMKGRVAADYPIPPTAPQGDVRLASFGISKISPSGATQENANQSRRAIHVRMSVTDNSQTPWTMDTRQQLVALPDGHQLAPAYVSTHEGQAGLPSVTVPAGGKRIVDLFYPLPPDMQSASQMPEFDVVWHVDTPQQQVTERTPFDRLQVKTGSDPEWGVWDDGWGGPFWYDPFYVGYRGDIYIGTPHWGSEEGGREWRQGGAGPEAHEGHGRR
jgi:hypothetical protein